MIKKKRPKQRRGTISRWTTRRWTIQESTLQGHNTDTATNRDTDTDKDKDIHLALAEEGLDEVEERPVCGIRLIPRLFFVKKTFFCTRLI